jgi:hypothetical protein
MGAIRPHLVYKTMRYRGVLTVADRWFASSQIHHGCTQPDGTPCRLLGKRRIDKHLVCRQTGEIVDRDHNAARNLRDWPDLPVGAQSVRRPRPSAVPATVPETAAQTVDPINRLRSSRKTSPHRAAMNDEDTTRSDATVHAVRNGRPWRLEHPVGAVESGQRHYLTVPRNAFLIDFSITSGAMTTAAAGLACSQVGSGPTRTTTCPMFSPASIATRAAGAASRPSKTLVMGLS